jgi:proteasome accessory factor B
MAADYSRIHRLLKILTLIQGQKDWTAKRLALECQTTERSIYRDLKMLQGAGVPYSFDKEHGGYAVQRDFFMPAVSLTLEESLALVALAEQVGGKEQVPFTKAAAKAITKIRCNLPHKVQQELQKIDDLVAIHLSPVNPPEGTEDVYEVVRAALANRKALQCSYDSIAASQKGGNGDGTAPEAFLFRPYTLLFSQRAWYTLGYHGGRDSVRCLKLNRFTRCKPTDTPYDIPKSFAVGKHLGNAWRMIRGSKSYEVELHFDADFAETIADTHWHPTQETVWHDDKSMSFQCTVDGLEEIVWWILGMGPHCVVKKPVELAAQVRGLAAAIVKLYDTKPVSKPRKKASPQ